MTHVLIAHDDAGFLQTCCSTLRHEGYAVTAVESVSAAKHALAVNSPIVHAALLDWKLPDGTGLDVVSWLAAHHRRVPVALVTEFWEDNDFDRAITAAMRLGASHWVKRGVDDPIEVLRRILDPLAELRTQQVRGNDAARDLLAHRLLQGLVPRLRSRFRSLPLELVSDAVTDAIVRYLSDPSSFDPARHRSIDRFIWMTARRTLFNTLRSARRTSLRECEYARFHVTAALHPLPFLQSQQHFVIKQSLHLEPDPVVRGALREWLAGDQGSEPWLRVPSLGTLPIDERRREIKRHKDRFIARVKRLAAGAHSSDADR